MFLASKQEETKLPDFGECSTGFIKYHGTFQISKFRIAPAYDKACLQCPKIHVFLHLLLQFGNVTCRSLMAFMLSLQQQPALTHSSYSILQKQSFQMWQQARSTVYLCALSSFPSACSGRAEQHLLPCSPVLGVQLRQS